MLHALDLLLLQQLSEEARENRHAHEATRHIASVLAYASDNCMEECEKLTLENDKLKKEVESLKEEIIRIKSEQTRIPRVKDFLISGNAFITFFMDGTKSVAKCHPKDTFNNEAGFAICLAKRMIGNKTFHAELERLGLLKTEEPALTENVPLTSTEQSASESSDTDAKPKQKKEKSDKKDKKKSDKKKDKKTE